MKELAALVGYSTRLIAVAIIAKEGIGVCKAQNQGHGLIVLREMLNIGCLEVLDRGCHCK
jgi:hypothetical protein